MFNLDNLFSGKEIAAVVTTATSAMDELKKQLANKPE
jgi:hypothetical protein